MSVKRTGITPAAMLAKCQAAFDEELFQAVKTECLRSYSNTGYLANGLRMVRSASGGEIIPPPGRLTAPQTREQFLERVVAKVWPNFMRTVR